MRFLATLFLLLCPHLLLSAQTSDCNSLTRRALEQSGFFADIDSERAQLNSDETVSEFIQSWRLPADSGPLVQQALRKTFDPDAMKANVWRLVSANCKTDQMLKVLEQVGQPAVVRMTALENAAKTPDGAKTLIQYMRVHSQDVPSLPRMSTLQKLVNSFNLNQLYLRQVLAVQSGVAEGLGIPGAAHMKSAQIGDNFSARLGTIPVMNAMYRSVSDEDLRDYVRVLTSEPVRTFYLNAMQAEASVRELQGKLLGEEIKKNLPPGSISPAAISVGAAAAAVAKKQQTH